MPTRRSSVRFGATSVPETSHPDEDAALRHFSGDGVVALEWVRRQVSKVATGNQTGRAVLFREVGDCPHGVADDRHVRPGEWYHLIVSVYRLCPLAGFDDDRGERGDQQPGIENAFNDREDIRVDRDLRERRAVDEEVVDAVWCADLRRDCPQGRCRGLARA